MDRRWEVYLGAALVLGVAANELFHAAFGAMDFMGNAEFVGSTLTMSATADPGSWRAVSHPEAGAIAFGLIWIAHAIGGALAFYGSYRIARESSWRAGNDKAFAIAIVGIGIATVLYLVGFLAIGCGWFLLCSAPTPPNYVPDAQLNFICYMAVIIYLLLIRRTGVAS